MLNILNHHLDGVISAVICLILTVFLIWVRRTREFYWTDFWYAFPWFGGLARAIREKNLHPVQDDITAQTITPRPASAHRHVF